MSRRPWRRCPACLGVCHWHDEAWVCDECGDEWYPDHGRRFSPPEPTQQAPEGVSRLEEVAGL